MKLAIDIFGCTMETLMLAYFYHKMLGKIKLSKIMTIMTYIILGCIDLSIATFIEQSNIRTICMFIFVFIPLFFYPGNLIIKGLLSLIFLAVQMLSEILTKAISLSFYGDYLLLEVNFMDNYLYGVVFSKILAILIIVALTFVLHIRETEVPIYLFCILLIIPISSMVAVYELKEMNYLLNSQKNYIVLTMIIFLLLFANLVLFYLFDKILEIGFLRAQITVGETLIREQKLYYEKLTRQQEEIRSLSHDMNNNLLILSGHITDGNLEAANNHIQKLHKAIANNKPVITGYSVLDMVLASKKELSEIQDTVFDITFFIITELTIDIADVAIVIANCLDNALEATSKIIEPENRYILLDMKTKGNYLLIKVSNTVIEKIKISHNKIETSKADLLNHGFGLRNVEKIADKHDGSLRLECNENLFVASVMLRLDDSQLEQ